MENNDTPFDITFALDIIHNLCNVSPSLLDIEGHFDYTDEDAILDMDENDNTEHKEPLGFIRIGLKQEKNSDWNVFYHGTVIHSIKGIVENGYKISANPKRFKNKREVYGPGIYSSPDPDFALDSSRQGDFRSSWKTWST